jgi:hypothetical protein
LSFCYLDRLQDTRHSQVYYLGIIEGGVLADEDGLVVEGQGFGRLGGDFVEAKVEAAVAFLRLL